MCHLMIQNVLVVLAGDSSYKIVTIILAVLLVASVTGNVIAGICWLRQRGQFPQTKGQFYIVVYSASEYNAGPGHDLKLPTTSDLSTASWH